MLSSIVLVAALTLAPMNSEQAKAYSPDARDMKGFEPSLYQGKWFDPGLRKIRKCIMFRESRFDYTARNSTSSAAGAYQFLDKQWRNSLVWMMLKESNETNDGLQDTVKLLRKKNISTWSRYWQDRAFYTAWRHGEGKAHWYHSGIKC
jgi:hypothetical protein